MLEMNDIDKINELLSGLDLGNSEQMIVFMEGLVQKVEDEIDTLLVTGEEKSIYDAGKMVGKLEERLMIAREKMEKSNKDEVSEW